MKQIKVDKNIVLAGVHKDEVTKYAERKGVRLYEIAHVIGCNDSSFSRKLRYMTTDDVKNYKEIIDAIAEAKQQILTEGE